jgi:hypothetical protein
MVMPQPQQEEIIKARQLRNKRAVHDAIVQSRAKRGVPMDHDDDGPSMMPTIENFMLPQVVEPTPEENHRNPVETKERGDCIPSWTMADL